MLSDHENVIKTLFIQTVCLALCHSKHAEERDIGILYNWPTTSSKEEDDKASNHNTHRTDILLLIDRFVIGV
jgi:hypothetical protein